MQDAVLPMMRDVLFRLFAAAGFAWAAAAEASGEEYRPLIAQEFARLNNSYAERAARIAEIAEESVFLAGIFKESCGDDIIPHVTTAKLADGIKDACAELASLLILFRICFDERGVRNGVPESYFYSEVAKYQKKIKAGQALHRSIIEHYEAELQRVAQEVVSVHDQIQAAGEWAGLEAELLAAEYRTEKAKELWKGISEIKTTIEALKAGAADSEKKLEDYRLQAADATTQSPEEAQRIVEMRSEQEREHDGVVKKLSKAIVLRDELQDELLYLNPETASFEGNALLEKYARLIKKQDLLRSILDGANAKADSYAKAMALQDRLSDMVRNYMLLVNYEKKQEKIKRLTAENQAIQGRIARIQYLSKNRERAQTLGTPEDSPGADAAAKADDVAAQDIEIVVDGSASESGSLLSSPNN